MPPVQLVLLQGFDHGRPLQKAEGKLVQLLPRVARVQDDPYALLFRRDQRSADCADREANGATKSTRDCEARDRKEKTGL